MRYREKFKDIMKFVEDNCSADDFTLTMHCINKTDIRFAQNAITQNIDGELVYLRLDVSYGSKTGSASVNQWDNTNLENMLKSACSIAKQSHEDPEYVKSSCFIELPKIENFHTATAELSPEEMVRNIKRITDFSDGISSKASGIARKNVSELFSSTGNGFYDENEISLFSISASIKKEEIETKNEISFLDYKKFSIDEFIDKLKWQYDALNAKPEAFSPGRYTVILMPAAVAKFFSFMTYFMDQRSADQGLTVFSGKHGKKFMGSLFSLSSTIKDKDLRGITNFQNSFPADDIDWIKNGVLLNLPLDRFYAEKLGKPAYYPYNLVIEGRSASLKDLMQKAQKGLIVNDFWYLGNVDTKIGEITGMTRDGVLYFEDSEIKHPVKNFRFNEIPSEATNRIIDLGVSRLVDVRSKAPAMLLEDFNFVDMTDF